MERSERNDRSRRPSSRRTQEFVKKECKFCEDQIVMDFTQTELLKKHLTEKPDSPQIHNRDVTDEFAELVLRMLAKKKQDRPKDFHEILMKLRNIKIFKSEVAQQTE